MSAANKAAAIDLDAPAPSSPSPRTVEERVRTNEDGSKTFDLDRPVKMRYRRDGKEIEEDVTSLTLRRMNGGDALAVMNFKNEGEQIKVLFQRLTGKPVAMLELLDIEDFTFVAEVIESFLPASLKNGRASSA